MSTSAHSYAQKARIEKATNARAMGIDDDLISNLVESFYGRIQNHDVLGPIFASKIENWEPHLARMKDFWASIAIESGRYHGNPMPKHLAISGLSAEHFDSWLSLWSDTIDHIISNENAAQLFRERAQRIANSLQIACGISNDSFGSLRH